MDDQTPTQQQPGPSPYEPPAIVWEHEFTALAACSPPDCGGLPWVCINNVCVDMGGGG